jgi:hypothetical protein
MIEYYLYLVNLEIGFEFIDINYLEFKYDHKSFKILKNLEEENSGSSEEYGKTFSELFEKIEGEELLSLVSSSSKDSQEISAQIVIKLENLKKENSVLIKEFKEFQEFIKEFKEFKEFKESKK